MTAAGFSSDEKPEGQSDGFSPPPSAHPLFHLQQPAEGPGGGDDESSK